jgi:hypothetical protein
MILARKIAVIRKMLSHSHYAKGVAEMSRRLIYAVPSLALGICAVPTLAQTPIRTVDPISGHTYEIGPADFWTNAVAAAAASSITDSQGNVYQGYLTAISSQRENDFILDFWTPYTNTVWIGLTDANDPFNFRWANGEALTFTKWSAGEPNNSSGNEDYVQMFQSTGAWNDLPDTPLNYIIEYNTPPATIPEPGTIALTVSAVVGSAFCLRRRRA